MNINFDELLKIIAQLMFAGITILFMLATYWEMYFMIRTKDYTFERVYRIVATTLVSFVYGYYYIGLLLGTQVDNFSPYAATFVRPSIFLLGCALAAASRGRCVLLKKKVIREKGLV
jgi:CDP-diglyceride synthetase